MRYVGNASLSEQIQERILTTFQQTLSLAQEGNSQEALLGCDFVLRLDPLFEPARQLQTRLNEGGGPIEVDDLSAAIATEGATAIESEPEATSQPKGDLASKLALLLEQRSFEELKSLALEHQDQVAADPSLREIAQTAIEQLEAQPYVDSFLESSHQAQLAGDLEMAHGHLEKARELDPTHPQIAVLDSSLAEATSPPLVDDVPAEPVVATVEETATDTDWLDQLDASSEPPAAEPAEPPMTEPAADLDFEITSESVVPSESVEPLEPSEPSEPVEPDLTVAESGEPAAQLDSEIEGRIDQLLAEGQEAFESSEYQTAIDAWSRIFLIDIDHAEASRRIELARKLKAEIERQIEEAFHEGIDLLETGKSEEAKEAFEKVLEMHPGHMGAREYIDKIEGGDLGSATDDGEEAIPEPAPVSDTETDDRESVTTDTFNELDLAPDLAPEPEPFAEDFEPSVFDEDVLAAQPPKRSFALIGTAVLVLVLAVGWFLYSKRQRIFPNSDTEQQQTVQEQVDPIERARELHEEGKSALAVNVLRRLPPNDARYSEAQSLIEAWAIIDSPTQVVDAGPSEEDLLRRDALLAEAFSAADQRENLMALDLLEQAEAISPLEDDNLEFRALMTDNLDILSEEMKLFEQGDWEYALPSLWRLYDADESNRDVRRLMVNSYFNLGLRDLQRGSTKDAAEKFQEALQLKPGDAEIRRLSEFAVAYARRPTDLQYRIFVKYHPFR